jgi:hypothetical protein
VQHSGKARFRRINAMKLGEDIRAAGNPDAMMVAVILIEMFSHGAREFDVRHS